MAETPSIAAVTRADFPSQVVEKSREIPVLVDFWAAWCGPCRMLEPVLARVVEHYRGKLFLAKVDTDAEQELAQAYGIRGIPALKLFRHGEIVGELVGVQPEAAIRELVDRFVPTETDAVVERARNLAQTGETDQAIEILRQTVERNPQHERAKLALAELLCIAGGGDEAARAQECARLIDSLPVRAAADPEVEALRARTGLLQAAAGAPAPEELERAVAADPDAHAARLQLGARLALAGRYQPAMEQLLELVRRNRAFGDDAGRKALLAVFNLLGQRDPLVTRYRAQLSRALN